ncbi:uroporphyrinogen-III synthase [Acetobacter farinalis]|nr:uroporphyrinogen-III synthase [Acetobacter farinalis]NHO28651.1 uroporphyrinogen-III synthase [Acetobacter farinalis]
MSDPAVPCGVLVTRPEPGLSETCAAVAAAGWVPYAAPALHITPQVVRCMPAQPAACVLTSGQAVQAAQASLPSSCLVFAVGDRTAQRARAAGFIDVRSAQGDAEALVALITRTHAPSAGTLLLLSGARQGVALAARLRLAGFQVVRRVAYTARPVQRVAPEILSALKAGVISHSLFFSSESAAAWIAALPEAEREAASRTTGIVISQATAAVVQRAGWSRVMVAAQPTAQAVLEALGPGPRV